ncbi:MAG: pallilysin-related adhesin [Treponema sp.]|uniref:pallilysin-related adhesin n=1 Tax=Treponema sp. TaxID=166 RepID=UPI00298DCBE1|nr:pallilysin-related adhesin [Treponema sp.]MCR5387088.1 pallilysin-related adhesin [Treponema sp.]
MKSKTVPVLFVLAAVLIAGLFFISRRVLSKEDKSSTRARIVTPKSAVAGSSETESTASSIETEKYETFVPLYSGETLISTLTIDINNDGYDDEVIIVRKANSQNLWVVAALLDSESGFYKRLEPIETQFTRTRTFSYMGLDVTGEHKNALIYQGPADDGNYIMKIYLCSEKDGKPYLKNIGDFACDGTVFIQQTERSESYALALSKGESFSVWVYKSDAPQDATGEKDKAAVGLNQIQQEYKWNPSSQMYELAREINVTAGRLAATELSRIQDGTVETFAAFLDGLWYKTSNNDGNIRYMYFNYGDNEIIQLYKDIQEIYEWQDSKLRHNGIYLTAVNADIMNLHRRFDIALVNTDEIKITLRDNINMVISENTQWDGNYKKMTLQETFGGDSVVEEDGLYMKELQKGDNWTTADTTVSLKFDEYKYTLINGGLTETGVYSIEKIGSYNVIQFRSDTEGSILSENYSMEFGTKVITETVKRKTVEKVVADYDSITFTPVKLTSTDCFAIEGRAYILTRESQE